MTSRRAFLASLAILGGATTARGETSALRERRAALDVHSRRDLGALAEACRAAGQDALATRVDQWLLEPAALTLDIPRLSPTVDAAPPDDASPVVRDLWERFLALRLVRGEGLWELAREASHAGEPGLAYAWTREVVRELPDHASARRVLGYQRFEQRWLTPYELVKARSGQVWDARFGWLPVDRVERYAAGERFVRGRWMSAEDDDRQSGTIQRGLEVSSEHYSIRTSAGLAAGVELAERLETLYAAWQQTFVTFHMSAAQLRRLLDGGPPESRVPTRHQVVLFRDRDEYNAILSGEHPRIVQTTGYYDATQRKAYVFAGGDESSLYHEATHQLFSEVRASRGAVGARSNFWLVEGIACLFEAYREDRGWTRVGGVDAIRLNDARVRLLRDSFYVPLAELSSLGMDRLQRDDRIARLYSQAAGMTYFLMFYDAGRYRGALVETLERIYAGRDAAQTLAQLAGVDFATLDQQYQEFLRTLPPRA